MIRKGTHCWSYHGTADRTLCNIKRLSLALQIGKSLMDGMRPPISAPLEAKGGWFDMIDDYVALIESCWAQNPQDRPSFAEIIVELRWAWSPLPLAALWEAHFLLTLYAGGLGQTLWSLTTIGQVT